MTTNKFTPGPWKWLSDNDMLTNDKGEEVLRALAFYDLSAEIDVFDADAKLIVSAPELLEACEVLIKAYEKSLQREKMDVGIRMAKQAIAKATDE